MKKKSKGTKIEFKLLPVMVKKEYIVIQTPESILTSPVNSKIKKLYPREYATFLKKLKKK